MFNMMQIYFEEDEIYINKNDIIKELNLVLKREKAIKNDIIRKYIINHTLKSIPLCYTNEEYYYLTIQYTLLTKIMKRYHDIVNKQKELYAKLTVKSILRKYIIHRLYRYPDGLRLNLIKNHFEKNSKLLLVNKN